MKQKVRIVFGYGLLVIFIKSCMYSHVIHICIRIAAAAEEVVYEVVAEPRGKPRSRRTVGSRPKAHLTLALSSRLKASPDACPTILNYEALYICLLLVHYVSGIV